MGSSSACRPSARFLVIVAAAIFFPTIARNAGAQVETAGLDAPAGEILPRRQALFGRTAKTEDSVAVRFESGAIEQSPSMVSAVAATAPPSSPSDAKTLPGQATLLRSAAGSSQISLPQGAAKMRGMGESFSADPSTGIVRYDVPFDLPTARGAAQPSLGLMYSSGGGHGLAGVGWSVGVGSISRQLDRGPPRYQDPAEGAGWHENQDRFVFGTSELVPICLVQGTTCPNAEPGEVMPAWAAGWQYFRARVEGAFLRYFWSPDHRSWRVQSKTGLSMEYGVPLDGSGDTGALEADPYQPSHIFSWHLSRMYDTLGDANPSGSTPPRPVNVAVYKYIKLQASSYLVDIFDTPPSAEAATAPLDSYAHHTHLRYESRPDVLTSYRRGWASSVARRLQGVDVTSHDFSVDGSARKLVRRYHLSYAQDSHVSLLDSVQVEGRCPHAIPEDDQARLPEVTSCPVLPPVSFGYEHVTGFRSDGVPTDSDLQGFEGFDERIRTIGASPPHSINEQLTGLVDVNADGLPDIVVTDPARYGAHGVFFNGPNGQRDRFGPAQVLGVEGVADANVLKFSNSNVSVLDVDGDGIADLVHMPRTKTYSVYSLGVGATGSLSWHGRSITTASEQSPKIDFVQQNPEIRLMDVNADGLIDFVHTGSTEIQTFLALGRFPGGDGQYGNASWKSSTTARISNEPLTSCIPWSALPIRFSDPDVHVADMNGDGFPDIVRVRHDDVRYWPGRGNGFWGTGVPDACRAGLFGQNQHVEMGNSPPLGMLLDEPFLLEDVNGDGLADVVRTRFNAIDVYLNVDGVAWTARHVIENAPPSSTVTNRIRIIDINGSGTPDILWGEGLAYKYMDLTGGARPWVLSSVDNGLGRTTTFEYATSTELMLAAEKSGSPWNKRAPTVAHVVVRVTERDNLELVGRSSVPNVTEYTYRDPVYDGRQRAFRGFETVRVKSVGDTNSPTSLTETAFLLGECIAEPSHPKQCSISERWMDNPREALTGLPVVTESFDEAGIYLSTQHTTYRLRRLYTGLDGRDVRHALLSSTDNYRYDTAAFVPSVSTVTLNDLELERTSGTVEPSSPRLLRLRSGPGRAHLRQRVSVDRFGNTVDQINLGCIEGCSDLDETITTHATPTSVAGDSSGWLFRTFESWVEGSRAPSLRRRRMQHFYDARGLLSFDRIVLSETLPLDRFHELAGSAVAPTPTGAVVDGTHTIFSYTYDDFGNRLFSNGHAGHCTAVRFDAAFAQLVVEERLHTGYPAAGSPCGPYALASKAEYDRGLEAISKITGANDEVSTVVYDAFGRLATLYAPDPNAVSAPSTVPSLKIDYFVPDGTGPYSPTGKVPYSRVRVLTQDGADAATASFRTSWSYIDGRGRTIATVAQADLSAGDSGPWIVSGINEYDASGAVSKSYLNSFYPGDPSAYRLDSGDGAWASRQVYDSFGRVREVYSPDESTAEAIVARNMYHAMETDTWDAADLEGGGEHEGTPSTVRVDGHGRRIAAIERFRLNGQLQSQTTTTSYAPTGEPLVVTRSAPGSTSIVRWMRYDSFGRLVLNAEPNTTKNFSPNPNTAPASMKAWRYAYDLLGQLVGTSDPRGCGRNIYYLSDGRVLGEDYSPCEAEHQTYSTPNMSLDPADPLQRTIKGDGLEVLYRYDSADPEQSSVEDFPPIASASVAGYMTAASDRAAKAVLHRDLRGRVTALARRVAKPGPPENVVAERYAPHWYVKHFQYDGADRLTKESTGADVPELLGEASSTDVTTQYSKRGAIASVGSSYRPLVANTTRDADGLVTAITYGDLAATNTSFQYDIRKRLEAVRTHRGPPILWTQQPPLYSPEPNPSAGSSVFQTELEHYAFEYDAVDNPKTIVDFRDLGAWPTSFKPRSRQFQYDDFYRLTRAEYLGIDQWASPFAEENADPTGRSSPAPHVSFANRVLLQTFDYDALGSTTRTDDDAHGFYDRSLGTIVNGTANAGPYQLRHAAHASGGPRDGELSAAYDHAGNLVSLAIERDGPCLPAGALCSQRFAYDWDEVGRLARARRWDLSTPEVATDPLPNAAAVADLRYAYDADDKRVLKTAADLGGGELHTVYVFESLELRRARFADGDFERTASTVAPYLFANGLRLARLYYTAEDIPTLSSGRLHVFFELTDHLGSSSFVVDGATSELVEATRYEAYGATEADYRPERWKAYRDDYRFTGKEEDIEVGLAYSWHRYYSPFLARWVSPDPLALHAPGQADLNLYAYVHGRVLRAVDPTGLDSLPGGTEDTPTSSNGPAGADGHMIPPDYGEGLIGPPALVGPPAPATSDSSVASTPSRAQHNIKAEKVPLLPFFLSDGPLPYPYTRDVDTVRAGTGWAQSVRPYQDPGPDAPNGLATLRQLNAGTPLVVSQFSREHAPGTSVQNLTIHAVSVITEAGGAVSAASRGAAVARKIATTESVIADTADLAENLPVIVSDLPGPAGVQIPRRLNYMEMEGLTKQYGVEMALIYRAGPRKNGGGGTYWLHSGTRRSAAVPIGPDVRLISHTHPGGTPYASSADRAVLGLLRKAGSPQRSSIVIPMGRGPVRFWENE